MSGPSTWLEEVWDAARTTVTPGPFSQAHPAPRTVEVVGDFDSFFFSPIPPASPFGRSAAPYLPLGAGQRQRGEMPEREVRGSGDHGAQ